MSKSKSNKNLNPGKHSKSVGNMTETKSAGLGFFTKASELKPLKPIRVPQVNRAGIKTIYLLVMKVAVVHRKYISG